MGSTVRIILSKLHKHYRYIVIRKLTTECTEQHGTKTDLLVTWTSVCSVVDPLFLTVLPNNHFGLIKKPANCFDHRP